VTAALLTFTLDPVYGCHLWTGPVGSNGRPIVWRGARPSSGYVVAYQQAGLLIAAGHVLDHLCRRPLCVNVAHLEPVTTAENERRKSWAYRCKRQRCSRGHSLADALVTPEMGRLCRVCTSGQRAIAGPVLVGRAPGDENNFRIGMLFETEADRAHASIDRREHCLDEHGYGCTRPECGRAPGNITGPPEIVRTRGKKT